jgi:transcriptional regulator with AAA-type ATPase domain
MFKYNKLPQPDYPTELFDSIREFLNFNSLESKYINRYHTVLSKAIYLNEIVHLILNKNFDRISFRKKLISGSFEDVSYLGRAERPPFDYSFVEKLANIISNDEEFKAAVKGKPDENYLIEKLATIAFESNLLDGVSEQNQLNILLKNKPDKATFKKLVEDDFKDLIVKIITTENFKKNDILTVYEIIKRHHTEKDRLEKEKLVDEKPLIVPPGLRSAVHHFEAHFAVSGNNPIMILGETGVGKSLFLYLSKQFFKEQHQYDTNPPTIVEANCAHFTSGGSGYSLARSELFGHVKGSFTDAHDNKVGLVEKANGGLLILEEVGELPIEVQAMLLTFIETGEYRRLGDEEIKTASVKVIAATNRESALRDDFRYRFFPYYITPLRERKNDILYYFYTIFPELTKNFTKSEVLMLLAHHWPGNVREIERIGRLLNRERWISEQIPKEYQDEKFNPLDHRLYHLDPRDTSFDPTILGKFFSDLKKWDVDIDFLEKLLQKFRLSVIEESSEKAFEELSSEVSGWFSFYNQHALTVCNEYSPFNEAYEGYLLFCDLFLQNTEKENNILSTIKSELTNSDSYVLYRFDDKPSYQRSLKKLRKKIIKFLMEVDNPDYEHIDDPWKLWSFLVHDKNESRKDDVKFEYGAEEVKNAIAEYKEADLLKLYYRKQLEKTAGNITAAAKRVGMNVATFTNRLKKLQVK